jgi:hypothetical protein
VQGIDPGQYTSVLKKITVIPKLQTHCDKPALFSDTMKKEQEDPLLFSGIISSSQIKICLPSPFAGRP